MTDLPSADRFVVCGLGSLGQHCVVALKEFGVRINGVDASERRDWDITNVPTLLDVFVRGDCRQPHILQLAGIGDCRAVLLVTSDERVNIEAAFAVRMLNPKARLIVRSSKQNLNQLIDNYLGDFIAFEATQLSAPAFAIAALGSEMRGFIDLPESLLRVVKVQIGRGSWGNGRTLSELNSSTRRILSHIPVDTPLPTQFHTWEPDRRVQVGDLVAYVEVIDRSIEPLPTAVIPPSRHNKKSKLTLKRLLNQLADRLSHNYFQQIVESFWQSTEQQQSKRVLMVTFLFVLAVFLLSTIVLKIGHPDKSWLGLIYTVGVMLLGAYDGVFILISEDKDKFPMWLRFMNLACMMAGTASIAVLYALLTEWLLSTKFQLVKKRPPTPDRDHVVLIGVGRVGQRVTSLLQQFKQPMVGVSPVPLSVNFLPDVPFIVSDLTSALGKVNLETARSVVIVTDDEMANLEIGLMVHAANPDCAIAIRVFNSAFGESISQLVPYAKVLSAYELAAQAFAVAGLGENVRSLIRLNEQTVLATEYRILEGDSLCNLLVSEIAYGYGVVPILQQTEGEPLRLMPSDDIRIRVGDRLILLATIEALQNIDRGDRTLPNCWLQIQRPMNREAIFDGERAIARVTGCSIGDAAQVMNRLPQRLPIPLYPHQAYRLIRELGKAQVLADFVPTQN